MHDISVGFEDVIRLFRDGRELLLAVESGRLVLYEEHEGAPRRELAALPAKGPELNAFFRALRQALAPNPQEKLPTDHGPLEPFRPPPEER